MDTNTSPIPWICGTLLLLAVVGGIFALAWHGTLTGQTVVVIVSPIVAAAATLLGIHAGGTAVTKSVRAMNTSGKGS